MAIEELRTPSAPPPAPPSEEVCAQALQVFRKRLSLTALTESRLGYGPLSKGATSSVAGIVPPNEWPEAVWQELVRQGKLRYAGHGLYGLVKP